MQLKSLDIQGFKSFPDKTKLSFSDGITAVVGPNGSGKSNISDAMRWVLGEQSTKSLRSTRMEDVVFAGTTKRKAQGFAEVTLTIDNADRTLQFDNNTVAITRRYYRSGESEFLINKTSVRLKDIHELFMDTGLGRDGYSIISQGKISDIVASRSEDRREIFEEAAGISRFRYRKIEAERRLGQAEENLLRLRDILTELESRVGPLKEQVQKANEFLAYSEEKKRLELAIWLDRLEKTAATLKNCDQKLSIGQNQYDQLFQELEQLRQQLEEIYQSNSNCSAKIDELRRTVSTLEEDALRKEGEASLAKNDRQHNEDAIARVRREMQSATETGSEIQREIQQSEEKIRELQELIDEKNTALQSYVEESLRLKQGVGESELRTDDLMKQVSLHSKNAAEAHAASLAANDSLLDTKQRLFDGDQNLNLQLQKLEALNNSIASLQTQLQAKNSLVEELQNALRGYELKLSGRKKKLDDLRTEQESLLRQAGQKQDSLRMLEELERNLEGFQHSVRIIMREGKRQGLSGIIGTFSSIIRTDPAYDTAIETALGFALQNIVTETETDAKAAISFLKRRDAGRATFLPIDTISSSTINEPSLSQCHGFIGIASELVHYDNRFRGVVNHLLGRIAVAEDLNSATAIAGKFRYRFRVVTLDGQLVNAGGSLTGGSTAKNAGLLSRRSKMEALKSEYASLYAKAESQKEPLLLLQNEVSLAEAKRTGTQGELLTAQQDKLMLEAEIRAATTNFSALEEHIAHFSEEARQLTERISRLEQEAAASAILEQDELRIMREKESALEEIFGRRDVLSKKENEVSSMLSEIRYEVMAAEKDIETLRVAIHERRQRENVHEEHLSTLQEEIRMLEQANDKIAVHLENLEAEIVHLHRRSKCTETEIQLLQAQRTEFEQSTTQKRRQESVLQEQKDAALRELSRLEERKIAVQNEYDELIKRLWDEYELTRREASEQVEPIMDTVRAQKRVNELKSKIKALGNVNLSSIEEYKEVSARYEFMRVQVGDVEKSRNELFRLISDLMGQMRQLFLDRFEKIRIHFKTVFQELFGGGTADLKLTSPEDVLNSGIEISVQPPGKLIKNLESLSGGEKSLVAIALYFSIMKVNPPPFCILDEIEAALDDVNVTRFANYLRRMSDGTQFIVITHRRGTMEEADVLYGVTMQDEGISKLLSLDVSETRQGTQGTVVP